MASLSAKGLPVTSSEEAEILACRWAVEFAIECGFSELVVEGDSNNHVVYEVGEMLAFSAGTHFLGWYFLLNDLQWSEVHYANWNANSVAHSLARYARNVSSNVIWLEDSPSLLWSCGGFVHEFYFYSMNIKDGFLFV